MSQEQTPSPTPPLAPPAAPPAPAAPQMALGVEPHLFDRLAVLYKYRWATVAVFLLVIGWVMVDSYTRVPILPRHRPYPD